jgi:hypothetical protein
MIIFYRLDLYQCEGAVDVVSGEVDFIPFFDLTQHRRIKV